MTTSKRHIFDNAWLEFNCNITKTLTTDFYKSGKGFDLDEMKAVQLSIITKLNEILGIRSTLEGEQIITKQKILNTKDFLTKEKKNIYTSFGMRRPYNIHRIKNR